MSASDSSWLKFWEVFAALGFLFVIAGCIIEGVEHFVKFPRKDSLRKRHIEKIGWFILIGGLAMEFLGEHQAKRIADRESARLTKEAAQARKDAEIANRVAGESNERASTNELRVAELTRTNIVLQSNVWTLRSNVLALEARNQPVFAIASFATLEFSELIVTNRFTATRKALLSFHRSADLQSDLGFPALSLVDDNVEELGRSAYVTFRLWSPIREAQLRRTNETAGEFLNALQSCSLLVWFRGNQFEIQSGSVTLEINSLKKRFNLRPTRVSKAFDSFIGGFPVESNVITPPR